MITFDVCAPMPKKSRAKIDQTKEIVRVTFRFHGAELGQVREVRDMLSLNSEVDAARYLIQRGFEAMTPVLMSRRAQSSMANHVGTTVNVEAIVKQMVAAGFDPKLLER
jgi:hypothetical protein